MSAAIATPRREVLADSTNTRSNIGTTLNSSKKRRFDGSPVQNLQTPDRRVKGTNVGSSQTKSKFEDEVLEKITQDINGLKQNNSERDQQWDRPSLDGFDPKSQNLCFQQIEAEQGVLRGGKNTVRLFGTTEDGHSVLLHVTDFMHYLYIPSPKCAGEVDSDDFKTSFGEEDCYGFKDFLEEHVPHRAYVDPQAKTKPLRVHDVRRVMRENLFGYQGNRKVPYLKITVTEPSYLNDVRKFLENSLPDYNGLWEAADPIRTFDDLQYVLRFMIDRKISGMSWVEVPATKYRMFAHNEKTSTCQIEASVHYKDLIAHPIDGEWAKMAPLRILSFDIECAGRKGHFPDPKFDPVIQIGNVVTRYGEEKPFVRNVFCMDTCSLIVNTQVFDFAAEDKMLMAWRDFVEKVDPDVIIGYNIANFDFPYLIQRAKQLKAQNFPYWSRLRNIKSETKDTNFSSKQVGNRDSKATNTNGRLQLDLLQLIQRDYHLRSYTLNSVSSHFLNEQKEDVHHSMITELFNGTPESRRRLAIYCLKDAYLPQRLLDKLMCLVNYTEMARVTGVPFNYLLSRGQQIKFISQLFRKAKEQDLVIPNLPSQASDASYDGATVIEPLKGWYDVPIATLDFASLYPSIMQAHNLCYTTLLRREQVKRKNMQLDVDYIVTPNGDLFCTANVRKGLLSTILEELLTARKNAKRELAVETDPFKKAVLNGRQLALKISANSVYGITGATVGKLPCLEIARSTTSYGRQMIDKTKEEVEAKYPGAEVIYGDTDSVMVKFGPEDLQKVMDLGQEAATYVSSKFTKPIKLEFEKVYFPYLLINKKRYAGLYWTNPHTYDKMDTKGIETVRRDNCRMVQTVLETVLRRLLIDRDPAGAQEYVKGMISDLLQNKVDMSQLVITKALTKDVEEEEEEGDESKPKAKPKPKATNEESAKKNVYKAKQAHVELAERMRKRDPRSAPALGDRVAYVIVHKDGGTQNYEKSEDPIYVLENNLSIDTRYYLDNQLAKPLTRIFEPILGAKTAQLLTGDHTRSIARMAPAMGKLMKFAKKTQTCMGCKKPLVGAEESAGAVCENCRPRFGELYQKSLGKFSELEIRFSRLWTQCQRCQGSMHCEVICSSKDCPIFYMRMKAKKDVEEAGKELIRFDNDLAAW